MQRQPHVQYPGNQQAGSAAGWADSPVLYLLTCYDVWSATPPRGCEPAITDPAEDMGPAA